MDKVAGPYDDILVKSSVSIAQDIELTVPTSDVAPEEGVKSKVTEILAGLLAVRKGRKFNELLLSDINYAIRDNYSAASNVEIATPEKDVTLEKDKVVILGAVTVTVKRG